MKKIISIMLCAIMMAPSAMAFADSEAENTVSDLAASAVETMYYTGDSTVLRAALMDGYMNSLAQWTFIVNGGGWASQDEIADTWGAVYSYLNSFGLNDSEKWPFDGDSSVAVPADYIRKTFENMFGEKYDALPIVNRMYSSSIVYDEANDAYTLSRSDGEGTYAVLKEIRLTDDASADKGLVVMTYSIENENILESPVMGTVNIYLAASDVSASGLMPVSADVIDLTADVEG